MIKTKRDLNIYRHGKNGVYHVRFRVNGKEYRRSTGKTEAEIARSHAWQIYLHESGVGKGAAPAPLPGWAR